jgi:integrase
MPRLSTVKLTKRTVQAAEVNPALTDGYFIWDSEVRGFGLRVYATGRKLFVFQYQSPVDARTRRQAFGTYPGLTAEAARSLALEAAGSVAKGTDPKGETTERREKKTMADVFPLYLKEREGKVSMRTAAEYLRLWETTLRPEFGNRRIATVSEEVIARWHSGRLKTPTLANRAVDLLSTFMNWAERRGYRQRHSNPCIDIERYPEERRSRSLTTEEYERLGSALRAALAVGLPTPPKLQKQSRGMSKARQAKLTGTKRGPYAVKAPFLLPASPALTPANPAAVAALELLILTGWREQEVMTLRWDALNLSRGVAVLSMTKSGRSERPLGEAALELLRDREQKKESGYVFPGQKKDGHITDLKRLWLAVKHAARLEDHSKLRLHDLRHSFTTIARDELGLGDHVIARLIGHKLEGMTSRYGEVRDRTLRNAADSVSAQISKWIGR